MPTPAQPASRRAVITGLASVAGLTLAGCSSDGDLPNLPGLPAHDRAPDADLPVLARAVRDESRVLSLVSHTRSRHPDLRKELREPEVVLRAHLKQLDRAVVEADGAGRTRSETSRAPHVPRNPAHALAEVVAAERALARKHAASALEAQSGALARVIASMSAAAAQQGSVLAAFPKGGKA